MKKILIFAIAMSCGVYAQGQSGFRFLKNSIPASKQAHFQKVQRLFSSQNNMPEQQKPTQMNQRVIADVYDDGIELDSTTYRYSGYRESYFNHNSIANFLYKNYLDDYFYNDDKKNIEGNTSDMQADTINFYDGNNGSQILEQYIGHYRNDNQLDTMYYNDFNSGVLLYSNKFRRLYNNQGFLTDIFGMERTAGNLNYDTIAHQKLTYNNDFSKVIADTFWANNGSGVLVLSILTKYTYNAVGKLKDVNSFTYDSSGGTWDPDENIKINYNTDGRVRSIASYVADLPPADGLTWLDSLGYSSGISYFTEWYEEEWDSGTMVYALKIVKFPGANNLPDSVILYENADGMSPFTEMSRLFFSYNNFNNPTRMDGIYENGTLTYRCYYEEFDDPTSIDNLATGSRNFDVAPNPFTHSINIQWQHEAIPAATLKLFGMDGRLVFEKEMKITSGNNELSVPELPSGLYLLQLLDSRGRHWSAKVVR